MWGRVSGCLSHVSLIRVSCSSSGHVLLIALPYAGWCSLVAGCRRLGVACGFSCANRCGVGLSGLLAVADGSGSLIRLSVSGLMD